jgi:hypothetical protein
LWPHDPQVMEELIDVALDGANGALRRAGASLTVDVPAKDRRGCD